MKNKNLENVIFIKKDITRCNKEELSGKNIDVIICTLGFSAITDWEKAIERSISFLKPNGDLIVSDLYRGGKDFVCKLNNIISKFFFNAYNDREILNKLKSTIKEIETIQIEIKPKYKTNLFIFHGKK
jgi:ubiquinone/menaquinone biosynthesis C-methylase UbiE